MGAYELKKRTKEKPMTRAEIKSLIRSEIKSIFEKLAEETASKMSNKLENAIGFRYTPPDPEIGDDEPYGKK